MISLAQLRPQFFQRLFFNARYIASGDSKERGYFPLGQGKRSPKTIAQADDLRFPGAESLFDQPAQKKGAVPVMEILQHGVIHTDHIQQLQCIAVLISFDGVGEGNLVLLFSGCAEVHQKFICYYHTVAPQIRRELLFCYPL